MIGTIEGANVYYNHNDHLSSSNVITNVSGTQKELIDYYPFGGIRLDEKANGFNEKKKFTGHYYDADTGLNYMQARYQNGGQGRFISQDHLFQDIGINSELFKKKYGKDFTQVLADPQNLNSYSYVENNPLRYKDVDGRDGGVVSVPVLTLVAYGLRVAYGSLIEARPVGDNTGPADSNFVQAAKIGVSLGFAEVAGKAVDFVGGKILGKLGELLGGGGKTTEKVIEGSVKADSKLPDSIKKTLERIKSGESYPHKNDGSVFLNKEGRLPVNSDSAYYTEYVHPTPGATGPGAQRIVTGKGGEVYYSSDHYETFIKVNN